MATFSKSTDDHSLESVPHSERQNWLQLTWNTTGIVTTLIQIFLGALVTFVAGIWIGIIAGLVVTVVGALLGWGVGHVAYKTGLASSMLSRQHGFGRKGSALVALTFGFMIIGFIALENALLYKGLLFWLGLEDTLLLQVAVYGGMSVVWILLTAFGFQVVARFSSITLVAFLALLVYMMFDVIHSSGQSWETVLSFGAQFPPEALAAMGADTDMGKFVFCINVLIGSAGALALIDGDLGRYAKSSKDILVAAIFGNVFMDIVMLIFGAVIMYAGTERLVEYYVARGMNHETALQAVLQSPDSVAAAFVIFAGSLGAVMLFLAQGKAQVLNTYSASLSLTGLADVAFGWRPGRILFVILANVLACVMLAGSILEWVNSFITILGVLTTCFAGIIIADYLIVARLGSNRSTPEVNWAGVVTVGIGFVLAHYVLKAWVPIEFATSLVASFVLYPTLRLVSRKKSLAAAT
ncbi:purine-cytosine permease-like transporter [Pseudomonas sp. CFBP 8770]|uniref:purine-cytosine permease family protein n=1 Tax=unclassified Pseudomonas TaxID=196821 RepID=UPI00177C1216|nr:MULTISPECIES: purine-cytosine permease-like transporter [unclassified Pseudomonas]MBD8473204.1 purine-cytosine permease-like transporter [Pseudomonas sp. CFBP 8773]MBD8646331.1 purine-cytosine permease-like transporter [Pseudomonas sp. CFBP 8770]